MAKDTIHRAKTLRRVTFSLPDMSEDREDVDVPKKLLQRKSSTPLCKLTVKNLEKSTKKDEFKVHGTARYINGTLNFCNTDYKATAEKEDANKSSKILPDKEDANKPNTILPKKTADRTIVSETRKLTTNLATRIPTDLEYWNKAFNGCNLLYENPSNSLHTLRKKKKKNCKSKIRRCTTILFSPSTCIKRSRFVGVRKKENCLPNTLQVPAKSRSFEKLSYKLSTHKPNIRKRITNCFNFQLDDASNDSTINAQEINKRLSLLHFAQEESKSIGDCLEYNPDSDLTEFIQLAHRWRQQQNHQSHELIELEKQSQKTNDSVDCCAFKKSDVIKNTSQSKMNKVNIQKIPLITTLLRASRNQDEDIIKFVLDSILTNGISEEDLNAVDCSGRTALSYLCSTNVTQFLEVLLQTPGIDINKPDIELNTPLHYASECGQIGAIRLLLLQHKLEIDAKNVFGFTPLMKAAIQGHTRCAKTLLFAGASPMEMDYKRRLRAEQWARFCGRHSCAEIFEKCSRTRPLDKEIPIKWSHDTQSANQENEKFMIKGRARANSAIQTSSKISTTTTSISCKTTNDSGIRSKISKVFNFVSRDKTNNQNYNSNNNNSKQNNNLSHSLNSNKSSENVQQNFVGYKNNGASLYKDVQSMISRSDGFLNKSLMRPLEVPKLEITSPHNQDLIKKYEKRYSLGNTDSSKPPALPPRRSSKIVL